MYHDKFPINDDHGRHMWFFLNRTTPGNPDGRRRRSAFFGSAFLYRHFLLAAVVMACGCALADSYWQGATGDFNVAASWNPAGVPAGVNAINDSGSNNVVLIRPGDPAWSPYDIRAGDAANASGSYLQTGSTNNVNGWFRLGDNTGAYGSYVLSNGVVNA